MAKECEAPKHAAGPSATPTGVQIPGVPDDTPGAELREARVAARTREIVVAEHRAWRRLADAIRRQARACVEVGAPNDLEGLAAEAEELAGRLEAVAEGKPYGLVESGWRGEGLDMNYLPFSPIMGRLNPASYDLRLRREDERAIGRVTLDETAEGAVGLCHGGVISGIWDEVLAAANAIHQTGGPTGSLTVRYRRPTPLHEPLEFAAWVDRIDERKVIARGECRIAGREEVLTEADAVFIRLRMPGIDWHRQDQKGDGSRGEADGGTT